MSRILEIVALLLLLAGFSCGQSLMPAEALDRYLARSDDRQPECSAGVSAIQIDASLPKLKQHATMSGFKLVSQTGQVTYRALRFTGDNLVKSAVIARFLANDVGRPEQAPTSSGITRENYRFIYDKTADYNGLTAYVFRLKPKWKRVGLVNGELWLEASTATPLRVWGDLVRSPSMFIKDFRFVQDYQRINACSEPLRLLVTINTRIAGEADLIVWLHSMTDPVMITDASAEASE